MAKERKQDEPKADEKQDAPKAAPKAADKPRGEYDCGDGKQGKNPWN